MQDKPANMNKYICIYYKRGEKKMKEKKESGEWTVTGGEGCVPQGR